MKRITIALPDDIAELVALEARRRGSSVPEVIRSLIARGLPGRETHTREIPWAAIFSDQEMAPARDLDAALASGWADAHDLDRR